MLFRIPFLCCFLSPILLAEDVTAVYPLSPLRSPITLPALHSYFYQKEGADVMIAIPKGCTLIGADSRKAKRGGAKTIIAEKNFSAPITMFGSYKGEPLIAILLEPGAQMIDCAPHIEIYGGSVKKMHSIVLQKGAKTEALSGKVINYAGSSVARNSYGFVLGDALVTPEDTVAFYNEETKDSTGFGIDWDTIDIAVANCNEIGSYGIYLGPNQKLPYEIGGRIYAGIQPSDYEFKGGSHAKAIYISESDAIGRITGEVGVSNQSGSRCIAYLLGPDFLDADNSLTLFNAQTGDSSGFDVDWDQVTLTSESRLGTCYGIYLAEGKSLPAEIGGTIQSHSLYGQSYGIWIPEDGALGCFGGHVSIRCSTERAYGYAKGVGQMPKGSSVGFFNISTKDSSGFNIDWKRVSISVSSGSKLSYGILLGTSRNSF